LQSKKERARRFKAVFPHADNLPSLAFEQARNLGISFPIASDFRDPICSSGFWHSTVPSAAVPEAAIHKKRHPLFDKDKVRSSDHSLGTTPAGNSMRAQKPRKHNLGIAVARGTNRRHDLRPSCLAEKVDHARS
jgi:hypothetical protein